MSFLFTLFYFVNKLRGFTILNIITMVSKKSVLTNLCVFAPF